METSSEGFTRTVTMDKTFKIYHRINSIAGIAIFAKNNWNSRAWLAYQVFNFIIGIFCFIFTSMFVIVNSSDLIILTQGACIWSTGVIMTISLGVCLNFRNRFRVFLTEMAFKDEMLEMPLIQFVLKVERGKKLLELKNMVLDSQEKLLKYLRLWTTGYIISVVITTTMYLINTIYEMTTKGDSSLGLLAFDMWFPWSLEKMSVYVPSFIFNAYAGYLCCFAYPGLQMTIILLLCQVIRQLRILTFIMTNLNDLAIDIVEDKQDMWQVYCTSILAQCVDHYIKLKGFSNRLNVICQPFYLTVILASIILVCMCSVQIAILDKLSPGTIKFYAHALCFIIIVLMFSLLGERVDIECGHLELAVTENWYIFDHKHKMNVSIFKMALSQRMPIFIFGSVTLSSPTFTWFLKTGMSFFTLMMSFLEEA